MVIGTGKLAELEVVHLVSTWDTQMGNTLQTHYAYSIDTGLMRGRDSEESFDLFVHTNIKSV